MIQHIEKHIENLREKPEHVRKRFAFITSLSITLIIFFGWIASYGIQSNSVVSQNIETKTPLSSLTAGVGDVWDYIKGMFVNSNKAEYSAGEIEVTAGKR